jgi:hypothetical protein
MAKFVVTDDYYSVDDDVAERAAKRNAKLFQQGVNLDVQLSFGRYLMVGRREVQRLHLGGRNIVKGPAYTAPMSRWLDERPWLKAIHTNVREDSLWLAERPAETIAVIKRLRESEDSTDQYALRIMGVHALRIRVANHLLGGQMPEPHEPTPRRLTPTERLNFLLLALRDSGQAYDEDAARLRILNRKAFNDYVEYERGEKTQIVRLDESDPDDASI